MVMESIINMQSAFLKIFEAVRRVMNFVLSKIVILFQFIALFLSIHW